MPTQKTITVYSYSELSGKAKDNARDTLQEWLTGDEWYEFVYDEYLSQLQAMGVDIEASDISFSGFWSQGDGASFVGKVTDNELFLSSLAKRGYTLDYHWQWLDFDYLDIRFVRTSHHYCQENTVNTEVDYNGSSDTSDSAIGQFLDDTQDTINQWRRDVCRDIYSRLESEYEYLTGEESLVESAEANEYQFDQFGMIV